MFGNTIDKGVITVTDHRVSVSEKKQRNFIRLTFDT